ncbi:MAG: hypothetical protein R3338_07205 [Thermoanaerobaculia bacterium]|nr:hypothetical protein [Thermoanaerobaculia bacterium]
MKRILPTALVVLFLLAGCGGSDPTAVQELEGKVDSLEQRIATLENNLQETRLELAGKENDIEKLKEDLRTVGTIVDKNTVRIDRVER